MACSSDPDVLASQKKPSTYFDAQVLQSCRAGFYVGYFTTGAASDSGPPFAFSGTMNFRLVANKTGEFLELQDNAHMSGRSDQPIAGATVSATLRSTSPCHDGQITTAFENGVYTVPGAPPISFTGSSIGNYDTPTDAFAGFWRASVQLGGGEPIELVGAWYAIRQP
jgi:hypothetical protein